MLGVLPALKPAGWTSRDAVNKVQRFVRPVKVGHTGTLDPLATGVLLIVLGPATRLVEFSHAARKRYVGTFQLGCRSDTLDIEGEVQELRTEEFDQHELVTELANWRGRIRQVPPKYSAVQIGGKRAYELARQSLEFELPSREVVIHELKLLNFDWPHFQLEIQCSTGTYIRTLGSDIARALGTDAVMTQLTRVEIGSVRVEECLDVERLTSLEEIEETLLPVNVLVDSFARCTLTEEGCKRIRNGVHLTPADFEEPPQQSTERRWAAFDNASNLVAILTMEGCVYRSLRVLPMANAVTQPRRIKAPHKPES